ncbi:MAG: AAA family ATPase [Chloroflexi bacterium]|nr:AAA family ATPase [Chloroflexota bacterium]
MPCAACGTENRAASRFCDNCGAPLEAICPACGALNRSDARFCASCGATLGAATPQAAPAATAERRLVSVLFTDLVGFTTIAEDRDPEAVRELLSRYFDTATEIVQLHGGTVEKFIGDAVMAVWGTPIAHEDDAERAVRAALVLVDAVAALHPGLQARSGVLTGEVAVTLGATNQGMVAGDLVNTAARLQGVAEAGTVLVGETTRRAAERAIVFEPLGDQSLKGKTSPVPAWRALRVVAQRGGQGRADGLEPPFVGRDEELRQLKDVLHAVGRERRPRLVSITGPGGIGKSRLVWELEKYIDGVSEDIYWHRGRSPSYGEGIAFWALGEMVRRRAHLTEDDDEATTRQRIDATLEEHVPDASERERIGPALLTLLGVEEAPAGGRDTLFPAWRLFFERIAEKGTTVLAFEDLQWADSGMLDFIDHLLDWSRGLPIMVLTLARPELFDTRPDWGSGRRHLTALALEPLTDEAVRQLLEGLVPGLPADALAAIVGRAEGIPLYAVEMVRGLLADGLIEREGEAYAVVGDLSQLRVPDSLRSLIASRLDALEVADRGLLQDASVLGQVFSAESLAAISGTDVAALEPRLRDMVRRELLDVETDPRSPERGQFRFVQSLIREVAYGTLARRDRRSRHLAVARHYEAIGDEELAGVLSSHYLAARQASEEGAEADALAAQARLALSAAAQRAASLGAPEQAIRHLEQALEITTAPSDRAPLLDRAAIAAAAASVSDAERYAHAAVMAYREIGDTEAETAATVRLGRILIDAAEIVRAIDVLEGVVPTAETLDDPDTLALAMANLARAHMRSGHREQAVETADRALVIAERRNRIDIIAEALVNKGAALGQLGRRRESIALHAAALELGMGLGDRAFELRARNNYATVIGDDDPVRANELMREAADVARDIGDRSMYTWLLGNLANWAMNSGDGWDEIIAALDEVLERATMPLDRVRTLIFLSFLRGERGERIDEIVAELVEIANGRPDPDMVFSALMARAHGALCAGDPDSAYRLAMEALALDSQNPEIPARVALRAAVVQGDPERIRDSARRLSDLLATGAWSLADQRHANAAVMGLDGRRAEAATEHRAAINVFEGLGQRFVAAVTTTEALILLSDRPELRAMADTARETLTRLGARVWLERLDAALAAALPAPASESASLSAQLISDRGSP